ncbi:MAG: Fic family protein [Bacteroidales bacterium]|nr:Fic family protein [Bacteroidales bacterium]
MNYIIKPLPPSVNVETPEVFRNLALAHRYLGELKGKAATIPNETILINTLSLQEAKDSSAIENIITTHDELYKTVLFENLVISSAAKEVSRYAEALKLGFKLVRDEKLITQKTLLTIQRTLEQNDAGYRRLPGTSLINESTGQIVYTPPQDYDTICKLMDNLVEFINDSSISALDPLIKMALIHHQFESIHPFYDGNGRTGRILNILYLVQQGLLDLPVLYLSRYIIRKKGDYYRLLQQVRDDENWEPWILYILQGVQETARETIQLIAGIRELMQSYKIYIREKLPKIYSQDLLNNLFKHPYTKIEFLMNDLGVTRITATRYLDTLVENKLLSKYKIGKSNFYINEPLFNLFRDGQTSIQPSESIKTINPPIV